MQKNDSQRFTLWEAKERLLAHDLSVAGWREGTKPENSVTRRGRKCGGRKSDKASEFLAELKKR